MTEREGRLVGDERPYALDDADVTGAGPDGATGAGNAARADVNRR